MSNTKKYTLLVPLAGKGQRMVNGGFKLPKPMLLAGHKTILEWGLDSIDYSECELIFIVRQDHISGFSIDSFLKRKYGEEIKIAIAYEDTAGSLQSCQLAKDLINKDLPLIIFCPDVAFDKPKFKPKPSDFIADGHILTFKANSTNYSYVRSDSKGNVIQTAEKVIISEDASVGVYCFKSARTFFQYTSTVITGNLKEQGEFYIAPLYNLLIRDGLKVTQQRVETMYIMGTPEELNFFNKVVYNYFLPRSFILCSDHSGFTRKQEAIDYLTKSLNSNFIDCGCHSTKDCDYTEFIESAVSVHNRTPGSIILGFCRSGQGVNITANKFKNIRGVLVSDAVGARLGIEHNAANFFAIPEGVTNEKALIDIIQELKTAQFRGGRHQNRLSKVLQIGN
jgi:RpiB/LacA/LacB family sugar-phosphate isomerase